MVCAAMAVDGGERREGMKQIKFSYIARSREHLYMEVNNIVHLT